MNSFVPSSRFAPPEKLQVTLVPATQPQQDHRQWGGEPAALIAAMAEPVPGHWRVRGEADSGVTSLIVDAAMARVRAGISPEKILVIATSKESGALLRRQFAQLLPELGFASETPLVRSVHSYGFSLVRSARLRQPEAADDAALGLAPRLITGAEQDLIIQELLDIHRQRGGAMWPEHVHEALGMVGFARQLRDFLLRAQERGLGPEDLEHLGHLHCRPMWGAAGAFLREYEQITQLAGGQLYNASELVVSAISHLHSDDEFLADIRSGIDSLYVDDAQNLDPKSAQLLQLVSQSAPCVVVAGNPEHAVFHFRGATADSLLEWPTDNEVVVGSRRHAPAQRIRYASSVTTQHLVVADTLRRAHLIGQVPWSDMAVIVRSSSDISAVRRHLLSAGVPVTLEPTSMVLAEQPLVSSLLLTLTAVITPLDATQLEEMILGPVGGADAVTLRRLLRGLRQAEMKRGGLRRASDVLARIIADSEGVPDDLTAYLTDRERDILTRITSVIGAGRRALDEAASVELVLWEVWNATGLSDRLMNASLRGGAAGSKADIDLDAVLALFDLAGDFVERHPSAPLIRFVDSVAEQELASGTRDRRGFAPEAVAIVTAHGCTGRRWPLVVVPGVQEGAWPALGETGSLFGQEELVELLDRDIDPNVITSRTADKVAEERRLFGLACSRATQELVVTAVVAPDSDDVDEPSRFVTELEQQPDVTVSYDGHIDVPSEDGKKMETVGSYPRLLSVTNVIAELRRALESEGSTQLEKDEAARQLARMSDAGIYGAAPAHWWGSLGPSETQPVLGVTERVRLSPSKIESALTCPLRAVLASVGEEDDTPIHLFKGILIHAAAEAYAHGAPRPDIEAILIDAYRTNTTFPAWQTERAMAGWKQLIDRTLDWVGARKEQLIGVEMKVDVTVTQLADGTPVDIYGRMDRLERDADGRLLVVDLKTGKTSATKTEGEAHPQLFAYQLALSCGAVTNGQVYGRDAEMDPEPLGGGLLVYPAKETVQIATVQQTRKPEEDLREFAALLPQVVADMSGPALTARTNSQCTTCVLRTMCPAHEQGKALTRV